MLLCGFYVVDDASGLIYLLRVQYGDIGLVLLCISQN